MYSNATHRLMKCFGCFPMLAVLACVALVLQAGAQTAGTGNIQGAVTDATGSVIQNASVVVVNGATQVKHEATSDANGLYSFPNLPIGTYNVQVSAPGFENYRQSNVVLDVGSSIAVNVHMKIGARDETV